MPIAFFTIGHSTRSIEEFVGLLQSAGVRFLVDVRTVPRSRRNPQFNREVLPATLADFQIGYEHLAALGGLRGHKRDVSPTVNAFWQNQSFHNYADYAMTEQFRAGYCVRATAIRFPMTTRASPIWSLCWIASRLCRMPDFG
jgi:uncharacterized protein (DUF488 family)